jgi:hypothetical protein
MPPALRIDWCDAKAASYAQKMWHYADGIPFGKTGKLGVWEDGKFIGAVMFGRPASMPMRKRMSRDYNLKMTEFCELSRVALNKHKTPVTRILSICLKLFHKRYPGIRLIVSFADTGQGHVGAIYQAGNWVYTGRSKGSAVYTVFGKVMRQQTAELRGITSLARARLVDPDATMVINDKHRYLMAMDDAMLGIIEKERMPYPKKA